MRLPLSQEIDLHDRMVELENRLIGIQELHRNEMNLAYARMGDLEQRYLRLLTILGRMACREEATHDENRLEIGQSA